ncbi:hypothetical protein [Mycobacterium sp. E802]|uniref:hypothetical protein n=1 Tax=Mycobacterium sp. E802 TaxID=1834152 RepID=UPI000B14A442|nr:hypothetical protein [Mycobacterium sp. E802]
MEVLIVVVCCVVVVAELSDDDAAVEFVAELFVAVLSVFDVVPFSVLELPVL